LDYLSLPRWRAGTPSFSPVQKGAMRGLRIFPTLTGEPVSLDEGAVIPGEFELPPAGLVPVMLDLGDEQRWRPLLESLGVPTLKRGTFIEGQLLPGYPGLRAEDQRRALRWLNDNLNRALSEREEEGLEPEELLEAVRQAQLVRCEDGENRPAGAVYDPAG